VLYPGNPVGRADSFLADLDARCPGWRDRDAFILQVDCERWNDNPATVPSKGEIQIFCDRLVNRTGGKYWPVVYAPQWVYGNSLTGLGYPLWASNYVSSSGSFKSLYPGDSSGRWHAYSGQVPIILQYASSAIIGGQTSSDANAFKGTLAQLKTLVTPGGSVAKLDQDDYNNIVAAFADALSADTPLARVMKAIVWQYVGGGLQGAPTALRALSDSQVIKASLATLATAVAAIDTVDETALAASLAANLVEPFSAAIKEALPADLSEDVRAAVEAGIEDAASRIRLTVTPS